MPRLETLWQKYRDDGLRVVAIETTGSREAALEFIEEEGLSYTFAENGEGAGDVRGILGVEGDPTSYLIDRQGKIVAAHYGFKVGDEEKIEQEIRKVL